MLSKNHQRTLALSIILAVCFYLLFIWRGDSQQILLLLAKPDFFDWLLILSCSFGNYVLRFIRWQFYTRQFGHYIQRSQHFTYYLAGLALTTTPAKAGETLRSLYLKRHGVPFADSLACFFTERLLDVIVITLLSCMVFIAMPGFSNQYAVFISSVMLLFILALPVIGTRHLQRITRWSYQQLEQNKLGRLLSHLYRLLVSAHRILQWHILYPAFVLGFMAWLVQGLAFYYIMLVLGFPLPLEVAIAIYALSILAGAASFIPGGIGATETVMGLMLLALGCDTSLVIAAPILTRLSTLWFAVVIGLIANTMLSLQKR